MTAPNSKRHTQSRLPRDWRERLFDASVPKHKEEPSRLALAIAALWVTGCRPIELEAEGVAFTMHAGRLIAVIKGGKHGTIDNGDGTFERGLEWRQFAIDPQTNAATRYLAALCSDGRPHLVTYRRNSLRTRVNELGRQILGHLKDAPSVAPYSFRHAMASDLKTCDSLTDHQRSMVMGHLSVESLQSYGRRRRGGGAPSPVLAVKASAQPHGTATHAPPVVPHHPTPSRVPGSHCSPQ